MFLFWFSLGQGLIGAVVFKSPFHEGEDWGAGPRVEVEGDALVWFMEEKRGVRRQDHRRLLQGEFVRHL